MKKESLEVWLMANLNKEEQRYYQKIFNNFKRKYNTDVNLKSVSWNKVFSDLMKAFKTGDPPDVFQMGTTWVNSFAHLGYLAEKPDFVDCVPLADWMKDYCSYGGREIAVPWNVEVKALLVNRKITDALGINLSKIKTRGKFYELIADIKKERENNPEIPFPFCFPLKSANSTLHSFTAWLLAAGDNFPDFNKIPQDILCSQPVLENFEEILRLIKLTSDRDEYHKHYKHPYALYEEFSQEKKHIFYLGSWEMRTTPESWQQEGYTIIPIPEAAANSRTRGGGSVLTVSENCVQPELAWKLVEELLSEKYLEDWIKATGNVPAFRAKIWEEQKESPMVSTLYRQIKKSEEYPLHPSWSKIEQLLVEGIARYLWSMLQLSDKDQGSFSGQAILKQTDNRIKSVLSFSWERFYT